MDLSEKLKEEIKRKSGRIIAGTILLLAAIYWNNVYGIEITRNVVFCLVLITLFLDYLRIDLRVPVFIFEKFPMRPVEKGGIHGVVMACIGTSIALAISDFDVALTAFAMYLYGDVAAGLVGIRFGKTKFYNEKSIEGSLAMLVVSLIAGFIFMNNMIVSAGMAILATLIEMFVIKISDDLVLPLYTAFGGQTLAALLGLRPPIRGCTEAFLAFLVVIIAIGAFLGLLVLFKKLRERRIP